MVDLHLVVAASVSLRPDALAGDDQRTVVQNDLHLLGVDARKLRDHHELRRILGAVAVDRGPETSSMTATELRSPKVGQKLLELLELLGVRVSPFVLAHVSLLPRDPTIQA